MNGISEPACNFRAALRSSLYGEMKEVMEITAASANNLATFLKKNREFQLERSNKKHRQIEQEGCVIESHMIPDPSDVLTPRLATA